MEALLSKLHIFIILYAGFNLYTIYEARIQEQELSESQLPVLQTKLQKKKKEKSQLKDYYNDIEEAKQKIELVANEVEKIQKKFPSQISDTENLMLIKTSAESLNIKNIFLTPGVEENKGFYFIKKYEFKGMGTYLQFLMFFEKIAQSDRLLNVRNVKLTRSQIKQRGRFEVIDCEATLEAYRHNPDYKEDRGIETIETTSAAGDAPKRKKPKKPKVVKEREE
ncbi:MAG: hypothetical protein Fur0010_17500 [Bdellovibrio sp.]